MSSHQPLEDDKARHNNYAGDAFRAGAVKNVGVEPAPEHADTDAELHPSEQVDYRGVDSGLTSIGATDQNADQASMSELGTPGVRIGEDTTAESGATVPENTQNRDLSVEPHDDKISEQFNDPAPPIEDGVNVPT